MDARVFEMGTITSVHAQMRIFVKLYDTENYSRGKDTAIINRVIHKWKGLRSITSPDPFNVAYHDSLAFPCVPSPVLQLRRP
jgi:hypothetical protein